MTAGLLVLVQLVIAAMTTAPCRRVKLAVDGSSGAARA